MWCNSLFLTGSVVSYLVAKIGTKMTLGHEWVELNSLKVTSSIPPQNVILISNGLGKGSKIAQLVVVDWEGTGTEHQIRLETTRTRASVVIRCVLIVSIVKTQHYT